MNNKYVFIKHPEEEHQTSFSLLKNISHVQAKYNPDTGKSRCVFRMKNGDSVYGDEKSLNDYLKLIEKSSEENEIF